MINKLTKTGKLCYFMYKNIGDGCLISKYANSGIPSALTESAKRLIFINDGSMPGDLFCGTYICTWIENAQNHDTEKAILAI